MILYESPIPVIFWGAKTDPPKEGHEVYIFLRSISCIDSNISITPGQVTTVEYIVENYGDYETTGVATFAYFPGALDEYIRKINCFCYDAQTLKSKEKGKFTLILLVDPAVTKDSKTKSVKEATMQFTFFDYKSYKGKKSWNDFRNVSSTTRKIYFTMYGLRNRQ